MKKKVISISLCAAALILASCMKNNNIGNTVENNPGNIASVLENGIDDEDNSTDTDNTGAAGVPEQGMTYDDKNTNSEKNYLSDSLDQRLSGNDENSNDEIDVDLTVLSKTMVYSEVYDMVYYPDNYIGKTVKMKGSYSNFYDDNYKRYYHGCVISDATACCSQGIEFELTDDYIFPDDYPEIGEECSVIGVFDTYMEDG